MVLPAVFTGMLGINQTVGKAQLAVPPLSKTLQDSTAISLALFMAVLHSSEPLPSQTSH